MPGSKQLTIVFNIFYIVLLANIGIFVIPQIIGQNPLSILFVLLIPVIAFLVYRYCNEFFEKQFNLVVSIACIIALGFMVFVAVQNVFVPSKGDYEAIYTAIKELNENGRFTLSLEYYLNYPHQLFSTVVYSFVNRIFMLLGSGVAVSPLWTSVFNCFLTALGICMITHAAKLLFSHKFAYLTLFMLLCHVSYYTCNIFIYPHVLSVFFLGMFLFAFALSKGEGKCRLVFSAFLGFTAAVANSVEGIFAIGLVAAVIFFLLKYKLKESATRIAVVLASFVATLILVNIAYTSLNIFNSAQRDNASLPYYHWMMMGFSETGTFSEEDYQMSVGIETTDERSEAAKQELIKRIRSRTPSELYMFIMSKQVMAWSGENYGVALSSNTNNILVAFRLMLIVGLMLSVTLGFKQINHIKFFEIWTVGIILFVCIWEVAPVYLFSSIPIFVIPAGNGYFELAKRAAAFWQHRKIR